MMWQLGGKHSTFAVKAAPGQHLDSAGEFSPSGKLLFNAKLPDGFGTYRAYRLPWNPGS
jgi:hypothetical protein